jgi:hypothetical protein
MIPIRTSAVVVGIARYEAGKAWDLAGPTENALSFISWLCDKRGVPRERVLLFVSPADLNNADVVNAGCRTLEATSYELRRALLREVKNWDADLFYLFWGGHGYVDGAAHRRLFFADATEEDALSVDLSSVLLSLRSAKFPRLTTQVCFVDACANRWAQTVQQALASAQTWPAGREGNNRQAALFAASQGQLAANSSVERTGIFSKVLLSKLASVSGDEWPPNISDLFERVAKDVNAINPAQRPTAIWSNGWDDDELAREWLLRQRLPTGPLTPLLCDRRQQVGQFRRDLSLLRPATGTAVIRACALHGDVGEAHGSFVERLAHREASDWVKRCWGASALPLPKLSVEADTWPQPELGAELMRRDLANAICRKLRIEESEEPNAARVAAALQALGQAVVAIEHQIDLSYWNEPSRGLLAWYVRDFWGAVLDAGSSTSMVLFFAIICPPIEREASWAGRVQRSWRKLRLRLTLGSIARRTHQGERSGLSVLNELEPVPHSEVRVWLRTYASNRYQSDLDIDAAATDVLGTDDNGRPRTAGPMSLVERGLVDILRRAS